MNIRLFWPSAFAVILAFSLTACLTGSGGRASSIGGVSITITSPTGLSAFDTTDASVSLAGSAASEAGINQVTWNNDRGSSGTASGTSAWQINNISLEFGINEITVTAEDNAGARTSQSVAIYRESGKPGTATLFWHAPTARTDGAPLSNLDGYKIFYGNMSGTYDYEVTITNPGVVAYVVENLMPGNWYFAMTAYDSQGVESKLSNEAVKKID